MYQNLLKQIFPNVKNARVDKVLYVIFMIFLFSVVYTFFDNSEFAGWIDLADKTLFRDINKERKRKIFIHHAKLYGDFLSKDEFIEIPIIKIENRLVFTHTKNKYTESEKNKNIRALLFDIYANNNKLTLDEFFVIPINVELVTHDLEKIKKNIYLSDQYSVTDYFDRLYYSANIQTTLGFGDIFPSSKILRLFTMIQAISTIFLIVI